MRIFRAKPWRKQARLNCAWLCPEDVSLIKLANVSEFLARTDSRRLEMDWPKPPSPPSLQELVERHGTYADITPEAWAEHDAAIVKWRLDRADFYMQLRNAQKKKAAC
jgi:hypothetical protein